MIGLRKWVHRFRVSRGFTVHSPFAYHFITCVLRERLPYYDFSRKVKDPTERLLYRVAAYFDPKTVCCHDPRLAEVVLMACPHARRVASSQDADLTVVSADELPTTFTILFAPQALKAAFEALKAALPSGMTFTNGHTTIAVRRPGLPRQDFTLNF